MGQIDFPICSRLGGITAVQALDCISDGPWVGKRLGRERTQAGACAAFEQKTQGSLEPGKLADIVVLSGDIPSVANDQIPAIKVRCTIVGGRIHYAKKE